jgi:hypothetical protein
MVREADRGRKSNPVEQTMLYWFSVSGRGSAWLERLVRDQEVGGSNPLAPTILIAIKSRI